MKKRKIVGQSLPRVDAAAKVTGAALYVGDMTRPGMLHAKVLHSPHAHADIVSINADRARALPGVAAVLTHKDVPSIPYTSCGHPHPPDTPEDTLILSPRLRYVGDAVAAVAAETPRIAEEALGLVEVEYAPLPAYFTPGEAMAEGAVELHEGLKNICGENGYETGDPDAAMAEADFIVEDEFFTPIVTHSPIEPHATLCEVDSQGRLHVYAPTQVPSVMRQRLAQALGLRVGQVRVLRAAVGGGFGGKQEPMYEPVNAALALACGRPVMLELTREECIGCTRTRHASHIKLRTGLSKDGRILGREMSIINNTGAYASHGHNVIYSVSSHFALLYPTPNLRFSGRTVYTNSPVAGAMRGYGIPQYTFAMESHVDHLAETLGMDPLAFRRKNMYRLGDPIYAPHFSVNTCGLPQAVEQCERAIGYRQFRERPGETGDVRRGVGVALCVYGQSCYPHSVELSGARMMVNEDGSASLFINCAEIGQGSDTAMRQIAAETLGVPAGWINVISGDTDLCPFDTGAFASRQTYVTGQAVKKAAAACKAQVLDFAAGRYGVERSRLDIDDAIVVDTGDDRAVASLTDVTMAMMYDLAKPVTISHDASAHPVCNVLTFGCTMALVAVDTKTGRVEVERLVSAIDCGALINPLAALGQLQGGNIMGCGFALSEQLLIDRKTGRVLNDNLLDYKIPTFADVPDMEGYFIQTDEPTSAYGNKSLGEPPCITPAAAIRNAVRDAVGVAVNQCPLTPQLVLTALMEHEVESRV